MNLTRGDVLSWRTTTAKLSSRYRGGEHFRLRIECSSKIVVVASTVMMPKGEEEKKKKKIGRQGNIRRLPAALGLWANCHCES